MISAIKSNRTSRLYPELKISDGLLVTKQFGRYSTPRVFVPEKLRDYVIEMVHNNGHFSLRKTHFAIKQKYMWPGQYVQTKKYLKHCELCNRKNTPSQVTNAPLADSYMPSKPWDMIEIDLIGPLIQIVHVIIHKF